MGIDADTLSTRRTGAHPPGAVRLCIGYHGGKQTVKKTLFGAIVILALTLAACVGDAAPAPDPTPTTPAWNQIVLVFITGDLNISAWEDAGWTVDLSAPVDEEPPEDCTLHPCGDGIDFVGVCSALDAIAITPDKGIVGAGTVTSVHMDRDTREVTWTWKQTKEE